MPACFSALDQRALSLSVCETGSGRRPDQSDNDYIAPSLRLQPERLDDLSELLQLALQFGCELLG